MKVLVHVPQNLKAKKKETRRTHCWRNHKKRQTYLQTLRPQYNTARRHCVVFLSEVYNLYVGAFSSHICPKRLTVDHTYFHTLMADVLRHDPDQTTGKASRASRAEICPLECFGEGNQILLFIHLLYLLFNYLWNMSKKHVVKQSAVVNKKPPKKHFILLTD